LWRCDPTRVMVPSFLRLLDHTQRRTTFGRTLLDEWSARRRDLYLTTHNTRNRQTSMLPVRLEPTISVGEQPQKKYNFTSTKWGNLVCRLREEHGLRVFENRALRNIRYLRAKRDEVRGEWRWLHNEELHDLISSPDKTKRRWDGQDVWHVWGNRKMHTGFGRINTGRRILGLT
jgi:hypothetical protein